MSLYNALFGTNPWAGILMQILGTEPDRVPRFRDCYLDDQGRIVIHTRTGGGNRDSYENAHRRCETYPDLYGRDPDEQEGPWNDDLRKLSGYLFDRDDDFDSTYADFVFQVPAAMTPVVDALKELGAVSDPAQRWQRLLDDLKAGSQTPETKRALDVGQQIMGQISEALDGATDSDDGADG